ncbi:MAG: hypothetical protein O2856_01900 [Planctomycetota bacterium]|nr:hypothetical protein [Planctomycetota bacterium]
MTQPFLSHLMTQTWQIAVLTIIVAAFAKIFAKNRPHVAHVLWILVLIKCLTPPLWGHSLGVFSRVQAWTEFSEEAPPGDVDASNAQAETIVIEPWSVELQFAPEQILEFSDPIADIEEFDEIEFEPLAEISYAQPTDMESEISSPIIEPAEQISQITSIPLTAESGIASAIRAWLPIGLAFGAIVTLFTMVIRCLHCVRQIQRHRTIEFDEQLRDRIQHLAKLLGVRRIPNIIVSDVLFGPAVLGLLRHTIVLPRCLFEDGDSSRSFLPERTFAAKQTAQEPTSAQRQSVTVGAATSGRVAACREVLPGRQDLPKDLQFLDPILAHELLHIRRGDLRTGTLQAIVQSLWWFHPAVRVSNRWLSREAERCCDEQVIAELGCTPAHYARSLLSVIECKHRLQPIPVFPGMKPVEITTQRMERIMSLKNGLKKRTPLWCWLMIVALAFIVLPGAATQPAADEVRPKFGSGDGDTGNNVTASASPPAEILNKHDSSPPAADAVEPATQPEIRDVEAAIPAITVAEIPEFVRESRESVRKRILSAGQHTPWQLMQGLNGLRHDLLVNHDGKTINGLEWIQTGPMFEDEPWFQKTAHGGQAHPYTKPFAFQGHINQFAAILATCDVAADAEFGTPDGPITMADMVKHAQMTANETEEVCWTLQLLCKYLPPDSEWVNAKGEKWSIARLVKTTMLKATASGAPNGGTYGLFALAIARDEYWRTGKPLDGVWLDADKMIQQHIQLVRDQQNPNGTLSSNYFRSGEEKKDFDKRIASSGALLEFLLMAVSDEQLKEDWVRQAVAATVKDLDDNRKSFVSCSPLFKATNAFSIFLERAAAPEVVKSRPNAKDVAPEARFVLCAYPVADLVVSRQPVFATIGRSTGAVGPVQQSEITARSAVITLAKSADQAEAKPKPAPQEPNAFSLNAKAYFAPLTELIKATVQPDSWAPLGAGTIAIEEKLLCLVISQTVGVHGEICDLLSQLRKADDHMISITTQIVKLSDDAHVEWLGTHCSLHPLADGAQWALLPQHRSEVFTRELLGRKPDVLSAPKVMTISGQTATIQVGQTNTEDDTPTGIRLEMTPHLLPNTKVFRLQHAVQIGKLSAEVLRPVESLVGSGQTLVLLMSGSAGIENSETGKSQYLLLLTPEYVALADEESAVHPESDAIHPTKR